MLNWFSVKSALVEEGPGTLQEASARRTGRDSSMDISASNKPSELATSLALTHCSACDMTAIRLKTLRPTSRELLGDDHGAVSLFCDFENHQAAYGVTLG